jgi:autotransporter-associated beta strand protein
MKTPSAHRLVRSNGTLAARMFAGAIATLLAAQSAHAVSLSWDGLISGGAGGGAGTWDTNTTANWWDGVSLNVVWPNSGTDNDAVFAGTAGIVTLSPLGVTANDLTFNTNGYTLQGGILTLNGTTPTITTDSAVSASIKSVIAGSAGLTKAGLGTLVLSGENTYSGSTIISAGVLNVQRGAAMGTSSVSVTSGAALQIQGTFSIGNTLTLNGTGVSNDGALRNISGASKYNGNLTLGSATRINSDSGILRIMGTLNTGGNALTVGGAGQTSFWGAISGGGSLTADGTGMVNLGGTNTYGGGTNINSGIVFLSSGQPLGTSGTISFGGGTLQYSQNNTVDYSARFSTAASQNIKIDTSSQAITFGTALTSVGGSLSVTGQGTLTLTKQNTYNGATTVTNNATLLADLNAAAGDNVVSSSSALTLGGKLTVKGTGGTTARSQTFNGTTFDPGSALITPTLNAASVTANVLTVDLGAVTRNAGGTSNLVFGTSNVTASNTQILTSSGTADSLITDSNGVAFMTFGTSATSIRDWAVKDSGNTKIIQAPGLFYTAATATTIAGNADIGAFSPTITGAGVDNPVASIRFDSAGARTLTLDDTSTFSVGGILVTSNVGNNATIITGTGTLQGPNNGAGDLVVHNWDTSSSARIDSVIGGSGGFTKSGTGIVILAGTNSYTGPTTIGAGTLQIGNAGTTGDLGATTGTIINDGTLVFNRSAASSDLTVVNDITGSGGLTHSGAGTTILQGNLSYRGLTAVNAGVLTFDTGSARGWTSRGNITTRSMDGNGLQINANGTVNLKGLFDAETTYITGGVLNVMPGGELVSRNGIGNGFFGLSIGANENAGAAYGMLNVTGGTVTAVNEINATGQANPRFGVGIRGTTLGGLLRVSDGLVNAINLLADRSEITLLGGTIRTAGGAAPNLNTQEGNSNTGQGTSVLNIAGGDFDNGTVGINLNGGTAGSAKVIINVNSGTLWTQALTQGSGSTGLLNFNGGTLKVGAASATFTPLPVSNTTSTFSTYINSGGGTIDTNGFNITVQSNLMAPTGTGVTALAVTTAGSGYNGAPLVAINDAGITQSGTTVLASNTIAMADTTNVYVGQIVTGTGIPAGSIVTAVTPGTSITISQNASAAGTPTLTFKGQGATAYATYAGGAITGYVVTNPGVGYVGTLSVSLVGGVIAGGTAATVDAVDITTAANASGGLTKEGGGTLTLTGANTFTGAIVVNAGTLAFGQTGTQTYNNAISGAGAVSQTGTGTTILGGSNSHTGVTTISAGLLQLNSIDALSGGIADTGGTSALTFNGGVLGLGFNDFTRNLGAAGVVTAANFTGNGGWAAYGANRAVNLGGSSGTIVWATADTGFNAKTLILGTAGATHTLDLQNPLDLGNAARTVQVDNGAAAIDGLLSGLLSGAGGGLTKTGLGTLALSNSGNSYTGTTAINAGILTISGSGTLGSGAPLTMGGGVLDLGGTSQTVGAVSIATAAASGDTIMNGSLTGTSYAASLTSGNAIVSADLLLNGGAGFTKTGTGKVTLSGNNTYTGGTGITAGFVQFNLPASIGGSARDVTVTSPGTVIFGPAFGAGNIPAALLDRIVASSTGVIAADNYAGTNFDFNTAGLTAASLGAAGTVNYTGTYTPNGTTYRLGGGGGSLTMSNANALTGAGNSLVVNGLGTVTLAASNNYDSGTTLTAGTLAVGSNSSLGSGGLALNGGTIQSANSSARTLANILTIGGNVTTGGTGNLTFSDTSATALGATRTFTVNNPVSTFAQAFSGTGFGITKAGSGALVLTGTNIYTGVTTINGGVLRANEGVGLPSTASAGGGSNLTLNGGAFETGANLERAGGTGQGQMQITGGTSGFSANGAAVQIAFGTLASPTALTWGTAPFVPGTLLLNAATANNTLDFKNAVSLVNSARTVQVDANVATMSGVLSSTGTSGALIKTGFGKLVLTNANTYAGATTIYGGGTLQLNGATGSLATTSGLFFGVNNSTYAGGSAFIYDNVGAVGATSQTMASLGSQNSQPNDNTVKITRTAAHPVSLIFTTVSGNSTENGNVINFVTSDVATGGVNGTDYKIVLADQTTLKITKQNAYFNGGDFAVYQGSGLSGYVRGINYGVDAGSATSSGGTSFAGTTSQEITGDITAQPSVTLANGTLNGTLKINGPYSITMLNSSQTISFTGSGNTGANGILKTGGGTSTISGGASVNLNGSGGQADIRVDGLTDVLDIAMPLIINADGRILKSGAGTLRLSSGTTSLADSRNPIWLNGGTWEVGGSATMTKTGGGNGIVIASGAVFKHSSSSTASSVDLIQGSGGVSVTNGKLTLTGANTYTGGTTVSGGTLLVRNTSGSGTGTGAVDVSSTGTLGGTGLIGSSTTIDGNHAPGLSAGIQTFSNSLAYLANSNLIWELNDDVSAATTGVRGIAFDGVNVTGGAFSIASGATIDLSFGGAVDFLDSFWSTDRSWLVVDLGASVVGDGGTDVFGLGSLTGGSGTPSGSFSVTRVADANSKNDVVLNWTAGGGGASYATWAAAFTSPALSNQTADADPDNDGLENALEYVLGTDPRFTNQGGPSGSVVGTDLKFTFTRKDSSETADVGLVVQVSTNLTDWTTIPGYTVGASTGTSTAGVNVNEGGGSDDIITVTIPKGSDVKKFARLNVTITP